MFIELKAFPQCFRAPRKTLEARDKARGLCPKGIYEVGSSSEAAVRCSKKIMHTLRHRQETKTSPGRKNKPFLRHWLGNHIIHYSAFAELFLVESLAGQEAMPCSAFARARRFEDEANRAYRCV